MDRGLGTESDALPGSIDKSTVLDVKPLRCLAPVFPNTPGTPSVPNSQSTPFTSVPPAGPFPSGVQPFYPFVAAGSTQENVSGAQNLADNVGSGSSIPAPIPLNFFRSPFSQANETPVRRKRTYRGPVDMDNDVNSDSQNQSEYNGSDYPAQVNDVDVTSNSRKRRGQPKKRVPENGMEFDATSMVDGFLRLFKLKEFNHFTTSGDAKDVVQTVLLVFDLLRRQMTQVEEAKDSGSGAPRRPDLKAGALLMARGIRANTSKRIGHVPGIEIGDIFFFRIELCIVGLHAPSMAGIDYMTVKASINGEPERIAVSIVSSGGYENEVDDADVLIYTGQGGLQRKDGQLCDQKLERGNLALEKSLHRGNEVRVIRGLKDVAGSTCKIYVYDGLYTIQGSWSEKNKSGCTVFKYKLVRVPGQPEAFSLWKTIQQWTEGTVTRTGVILRDLTSGAENLPVALVNDVDAEKGPAYFTYTRSLKYSKPFSTSNSSVGCCCEAGCQPGADCSCTQKNEGLQPYSSFGVLLNNKSLIYECGPSCACPPNCRSRLSQAGLKARLEVFKTKDRGWGLRSWDHIRAGGFICEYAGDVINNLTADDLGDNNYIFNATRYYKPLESLHEESTGAQKVPYTVIISSKNNGNVARFMNHSCSPNMYWQPVLRQTNNDSYLHVAFFAIRHIPPMQELVYDYGMPPRQNEDNGKKKCMCGSVKCKGYFY